jgi:RHS repeat-associated protein
MRVRIGHAILMLGSQSGLLAAPQLAITCHEANIALNWPTPPGCVYQVQSRADLVLGAWSNRAIVVAGTSPAVWSEPSPLLTPQFYRLALPHGTLVEPPERAPAEPCACGGCSALPTTTPYIYLFSGEVHCEAEDLRIKGRGLDLLWARKYRSRLGPATAQGNGWDYAYNIRIQPHGPNVVVYDGNTRADVFSPQPGGWFAADGLFRVGSFSNGVFRLRFPDNGLWEFLPLDGSPPQGKINRIEDRNGNALVFAYDALGSLITVTDSLGRTLMVGYNADGFIATVTDFLGRTVRYAYYSNSDAEGDAGDLKSVTSPVVTGTTNGNDYPSGKTTVYTYSKGLPVPALNHNLLSITDSKGQTWLQNTYAATQDPADFNFDRVVSQAWGYSTDQLMICYVPLSPGADNQYAFVKAIVNDRVGNGSEVTFDAANRCVNRRVFTGRAVPGLLTTETQNRPVNPLRTNDPPWFETRFAWNRDSLLVSLTHPIGDVTLRLYEGDLNPQADPRARGNLRMQIRQPGAPGGDQDQLLETFEYDTSFGGCCGFNFATRQTDARGNVTLHAYDANGNRTNTVHAVASSTEQWEYNSFGQMTAHIWPDNGSSYRRRDVFTYYTSGPQTGYLREQIVDADGLALTNTYEHDAVGNLTRLVDPAGHDTLYTVNALDQTVQELSPALPPEISDGGGIRYEKLTWYDANNNVVRTDRQNRDGTGLLVATNTHFTTLQEYEILNRVICKVEEEGGENLANTVLTLAEIPAPARTQFIVTEYGYDANRNPILERRPEAVNGHQPASLVQRSFDERDLPFREIAAPGDPAQSTIQYDYDANGNLTQTAQGIEDSPRIARYTYDGYNRQLAVLDPMGNMKTNHYDPNGNLTNTVTWGELSDLPGSAGNTRLAEARFGFDAMNRPVRKDLLFFDPATQTPVGDGLATTLTFYSDNSQVVATVDDNNQTNSVVYDTANRQSLTLDAKGNSTVWNYDLAGNAVTQTELDKSDLDHLVQPFVTLYSYDNLNRLTQVVENASRTNRYSYDSRGNTVATTDARGNVTQYAYDGLNRLLQTIRLLTNTGDGSGTVIDSVATSQEWDDNSRLVGQTDPNANATLYAYDALDRRIRTLWADSTGETNLYDLHNNLIVRLDPNGNRITNAYDLLDRLTDVAVTVGPGVATNTTFERYRYDGLSSVVLAQNNGSLVTRGYDSLTDLVRETQQVLPAGPARNIVSAFDGTGNRLSCAYPGGRQLTCAYAGLNRKASVADAGGTIATYFYLGPSRVERRDYGNGTRLDWGYDALRRPASTFHSRIAGGTPIDLRAYTWDTMDNQAAVVDQLAAPPAPCLYTYDSVNRLIRSVSATGETTDYLLDSAGNRLLVTGEVGQGTYFMDPTLPEPADSQMNQYTVTPFESRGYDRNGNLTTAGPRLMGYDYRNQLTQTTAGTLTNLYKYDCFGRRLEQTVAGVVTRFYYAGPQEIEEQDGAGATLATYVWGVGVDELLQMTRGAQSYYYHADDLGSIQKVTDTSGDVVEQYRYGDYGTPSFYNGSGALLGSSALGNSCLFTGRRYLPETGFYYYRARYLDPNVGRFISRDGLGSWGDPANLGNGFTYCANNPLSKTDPNGLLPCCKRWGRCGILPCCKSWGTWRLTLDTTDWTLCMLDWGVEWVAPCLASIYACGGLCFVPGGQVPCAGCIAVGCAGLAGTAAFCAVTSLRSECR